MRLLGVLAVLAAILTVLLCRAITSWMGANVFLIFCHKKLLPSGESSSVILGLHHHAVK
jgi:putative Ca2+/H+ antiporter (TMEM165/GDT1 family)